MRSKKKSNKSSGAKRKSKSKDFPYGFDLQTLHEQLAILQKQYPGMPAADQKALASLIEDFADSLSLDLTKNQENLRLQGAAIASAEHAVFITDRKGRIEWVNDAYTRLTGYSAAEIVGQIEIFSKFNKLKSPFKPSRRLGSQGANWRREFVKQRKDGSQFVVEQTVTALRNDEGEITHYVAMHQDITSRKETEARIFRLAHYDLVTDLPNRVMFHDRLKQALALARRHGRSLAILFLDLDRFKPINDTFGHEKGDELLKLVGAVLTACVRATDTVARHSGDEFVLILQDLDRGQDAGHVAQKILEAVRQSLPLNDQSVSTTASIGIALYPFDATTSDSLVTQADRAMYRAKEKGGNCYQFVSDEMNAQAFEQLTLADSLQDAWNRQEFLLHFQPEVDLRNGHIMGLEVLLRWHHPDLGLIFPSQFIPLAQEIHLIDSIQEWVLRAVCSQTKLWQEGAVPFGSIGINLFGENGEHPKFIGVIRQVLQEANLSPTTLRIEIPQLLLKTQQKVAHALIRDIHELGLSVVIDDFVPEAWITDLVSDLPIHTFKLSQSLVVNLSNDPGMNKDILRSLELGQSINARIIAKGVEQPEQVTCLRQLGCHGVQGYFCNRPLPADEMTTLLRGWWGSESEGC